jgi:hypothetical protein
MAPDRAYQSAALVSDVVGQTLTRVLPIKLLKNQSYPDIHTLSGPVPSMSQEIHSVFKDYRPRSHGVTLC